jgi:hypothetical protein
MRQRLNVLIPDKSMVITMFFLLAFAILIPFLLTRVSILISPIIILALVGGSAVAIILADFRMGVYAIFLFSSFMFLFERMSPVAIPFGVMADSLIVLVFISFLIAIPRMRNLPIRQYMMNPISIAFIITKIYHIFEGFNPNSVSLNGFFFSLRSFTVVLMFFIFLGYFGSRKQIMYFVYMWLGIAIAAAAYGLWQEFVGLSSFEWEAINRLEPHQLALIFVWGHMRKFSFLSDPPAFGIYMGVSALASFMLALGPISGIKKALWAFAGAVMLFSMSYSGTRTAYAMVAVGMVFFAMLAIRRRSTMYVMAISVLAFGAVMFGPFHNGTIIRFRSAFKPSEDASMEVRDVKRVKWQPYIWHHPIGGGIFTTGAAGVRFSTGHQLAGGWDADSGYLQTALETGWIGLILELGFYFVIVAVGIYGFYALKDPVNIMLNLIFLIPFFAITVAQFTQNCMPYKPVYIIGAATYAVLIRLKDFERNPTLNT